MLTRVNHMPKTFKTIEVSANRRTCWDLESHELHVAWQCRKQNDTITKQVRLLFRNAVESFFNICIIRSGNDCFVFSQTSPPMQYLFWLRKRCTWFYVWKYSVCTFAMSARRCTSIKSKESYRTNFSHCKKFLYIYWWFYGKCLSFNGNFLFRGEIAYLHGISGKFSFCLHSLNVKNVTSKTDKISFQLRENEKHSVKFS